MDWMAKSLRFALSVSAWCELKEISSVELDGSKKIDSWMGQFQLVGTGPGHR